MPERGGQPGNKNAAKSRLFEQAFLREIKKRDLDAGDGETLRAIASRIIDQALAGDIASFRESRDTIDGKPAQSITGADGGPLVVIQATQHDESL